VGTSNTYRGDVAAGPYRRPPITRKHVVCATFGGIATPKPLRLQRFPLPLKGNKGIGSAIGWLGSLWFGWSSISAPPVVNLAKT